MNRLAAVLLAWVALAADDPWGKVRELKSGTEIRLYQRGAAKPLLGKVDEVREDSVVLLLKNEQMAVAKEQIDRLDYRPTKGSRVTREDKTTVEDPTRRTPLPGPAQGAPVPKTTTSSSLTFGSKPDFETIYRRATGTTP